MFLFLVLCLLGMTVALIAWRKGRNRHLWWVYGTLLFPVALPHVLSIEGRGRCPSCGTQVDSSARECPECGEEL